MEFQQVIDGEPIELEKVFYHQCCDCNLVHKMQIEVGKISGKIYLTVHRDNKMTEQIRKLEKNKV